MWTSRHPPGKSQAFFTPTWLVRGVFLDFGRACLGTPTSRMTIVFRILYASKLGSLAPCHPGPSITTRISPFSPFGAARRKINMVSTDNYARSPCAIWDNRHSNKYRNVHQTFRAGCCRCIRVAPTVQSWQFERRWMGPS